MGGEPDGATIRWSEGGRLDEAKGWSDERRCPPRKHRLAVIFAAFVSWEAIGLMVGRGWPTLSHVTRAVTRAPVGRWMVFIRGWQFFLRGPLSEGPRPGRAGPACARRSRSSSCSAQP